MVENLRILVERKKTSYQFKADMNSPDSWDGDHNAQHNMEDHVQLLDGDNPIWEAWAQTVANCPGVDHRNTIAPGSFAVKWNVQRNLFKGHIHGIILALTQGGQFVDSDSIAPIPGEEGTSTDARWIFAHSTRKLDPAPVGELTRYAWSAGCTIVSPEAQDDLYEVGVKAGLVDGDEIPGTLVEV